MIIMKFQTFMHKWRQRRKKKKKENLRIAEKARKIGLNQDQTSADAIVRTETDGDGGATPR